jgi:NAD+ kinase
MTMPVDFVLVRHGESEGNYAYGLSHQGDNRYFAPGSPFLQRHTSKWRLTERGRQQAQVAGAWLREQVAVAFDRYYTAEYLRAMETAARLGFTGASWYCEFYLRERDWGKFDVMPIEQRKREYADDMRRRELDRFFWTPPGGESMATLCLRVDRVLNTLHRECAEKRVLIVCHGEVMWAFRVRLERMSQHRYQELDYSNDPFHKIHNCQILHYTRRDPATGLTAPHLKWMRSVCPWDLTRSHNEWEVLERVGYANEDLLAVVERTPPLITGRE